MENEQKEIEGVRTQKATTIESHRGGGGGRLLLYGDLTL